MLIVDIVYVVNVKCAKSFATHLTDEVLRLSATECNVANINADGKRARGKKLVIVTAKLLGA